MEHVIKLLGTGELGSTYAEEDARKDVRFVRGGTKGVDKRIVEGVIEVLKEAGVVPVDLGSDEAVERVAGIVIGS